MTYVKGHVQSPEVRAKIAAAQLGERNSHWRGLAGRHWYSNLHKWLRRRIRKTGVCPQCGRVGKTDIAAVVFANGEPVYDYDETLFSERCRSCNLRLGHYARRHWKASPA